MFYKRDLRYALTIFEIFSIEVTLVNFEYPIDYKRILQPRSNFNNKFSTFSSI